MGRLKTNEARVSNPYWDPELGNTRSNPAEIKVTVNIRESSVATMHARGQITDKQNTAAIRFRGLYEAAGYSGIPAMDYSEQRVDTSPTGFDGLTQDRIDAVKELTVISGELGQIGYAVMTHICGAGLSIAQTAQIMLRKEPAKAEKEYYGRVFRDHLDVLCRFWGYSKRRG